MKAFLFEKKKFNLKIGGVVFLMGVFGFIGVGAFQGPSFGPNEGGGFKGWVQHLLSSDKEMSVNFESPAVNEIGVKLTTGEINTSQVIAKEKGGILERLEYIQVNMLNNSGIIKVHEGKVGVGVAEPIEKLEVEGTVKATSFKGDGSQLTGIVSSNWLKTGSNLNYGGGNVGIGVETPAEKLEVSGNIQATAFLYSSDESLKTNIQELEKSLEKVKELKGVSFEWEKNGKKDIGFIAQEIEKIYPELVKTNPTTDLKSVQYGNIVAILVEAIKEQQEQIEELRKEIKELRK